MATSYGAGDQGTLDSIKQKLENAKKLGQTSLSSYEVSVEESQSKGIAIITPDDTQAEQAVGSYKETVVDSLDSKIGATAGGILNAVTSKGKDTLAKIQGGDVSVIDELTSTVDRYKNAPKGYQSAILDDIASSVTSADLSTNSSYNAILKELGTRNLGSGSSGFRDNLVGNINSAFKLATGNSNTELLLSSPYDKNPVSLQVSSLLLNGGGSKLLEVVGNYTGFNIGDTLQKNAIVSVLLGKVIELGVKELIDPLLSKLIAGGDKDQALMWGAQSAILTGDIRMIDKIINSLSDSQARKNLYASYPNAVAEILRAFSFRYEDTEKDYPDLRAMMLDILAKFGGPNWMYHPDHVAEKYVNLRYTYISEAATVLLMDVEVMRPIIQCSGLFSEVPANLVFLSDFDHVPELDY